METKRIYFFECFLSQFVPKRKKIPRVYMCKKTYDIFKYFKNILKTETIF